MSDRLTLREYIEAVHWWERKLWEERDRRYAEVALEREKALKIKEEADKAALGLAREIQTYKDEKANELREQINSERGHYASKNDLMVSMDKIDAQLKPILSYVASNQGRDRGIGTSWAVLLGSIAAIGIIAGLLFKLLG